MSERQETTPRKGWANRCRQSVPVRLLEEQAVRLRALAERRDVPQARLIRQAIDRLLDEAEGER